MKTPTIIIVLALTFSAHTQAAFMFNENGLAPKSTVNSAVSLSKAELYSKTLAWIAKEQQGFDVALDSNMENEHLVVRVIKNNAVNEGKQFYHLKYMLKISFENEQFKMEPLRIQTKLNSKYDMGWQDFDFSNGTIYFKRGKPIKRTKSYVAEIPKTLNELQTRLNKYLMPE